MRSCHLTGQLKWKQFVVVGPLHPSHHGASSLGMDLLAFRLGQLFPLYLNTMFF